ncbi:MAG: SDR family oxidoreductase [Actinomycetales bacterium]
MYDIPDQRDRRIVVTGANSGTGLEATRRLARAGAQIVMAVRSLDKGEAACERIRREIPGARLEVRRLDLADLTQVRDFCEALARVGEPVHALVNNAGVMAPPDRMITRDGHELQWATNFLGPFALTNLLLPVLLAADRPRVVTMSSSAAALGRIDFGDLDAERRYGGARAYAQSKLADLLLALRLARVAHERGWPLLSLAAHPGYTRTNLQQTGPRLGRGRATIATRLLDVGWRGQDVRVGAEPLLYAIADPGAVNGGYYGPSGRWELTGPTARVRPPRSANAPSLADSLWAVAADLTGTDLPA